MIAASGPGAATPPGPQAVTFTVYGKPQPAGSKRAFANRKTGGVIVTDANRSSKPWQATVADVAAAAMTYRPLLDGPLAVAFTFYVPRPKGHYGKRGLLPSAPAHPTSRPDVLKLARGVEDALTGIVWRDDAQVVSELLVKAYGEPSRVAISVVPLASAAGGVGMSGAVAALSAAGRSEHPPQP